MNRTAWNVAPVLALLTLSAAPLSARAAAAPQTVAEKSKDAVVKGATVATDTTKQALSKTGEVMTDEWITARVHTRFVGEELLKDSDISVDVSKHVVTLTGTVTGGPGRTKAGNIARRTEGVHRVVNRLTVGPKRTN